MNHFKLTIAVSAWWALCFKNTIPKGLCKIDKNGSENFGFKRKWVAGSRFPFLEKKYVLLELNKSYHFRFKERLPQRRVWPFPPLEIWKRLQGCVFHIQRRFWVTASFFLPKRETFYFDIMFLNFDAAYKPSHHQ